MWKMVPNVNEKTLYNMGWKDLYSTATHTAKYDWEHNYKDTVYDSLILFIL